ncbi:helix-turn-helix domain-containing protein [Neomegalonema sp.]|uniref:helix-turn-helix domain-containing protein n=1 Tax=Neomegalonema sp. TaxID=2039713 RepID=UPI0026106466|nr:helix-turn-helix domain-containing protein [Neomegalonema sp.]MDD2869029.1 helix-turn-helix domain-containing protein [Neomegalonema sp.]
MTAHRSISTLRFEEADVSLGDELRGARASSGRSLDQIERDLKIKAAYLLAIEDVRPDRLPDPAYAAGFLRVYARYLGLDPEKTAQRFQKEVEGQGQGEKSGVARILAPLTHARRGETESAPLRRMPPREDPLAGLARRRERGRVWRGLLGGIAMLAPLAFAGGILWGGWKLMDHAGVAAVFSGGEPQPAAVTVAALERPSAAAYERSVDAYWAAASDTTAAPPPLPPIDAPLASALTRTAAATPPASAVEGEALLTAGAAPEAPSALPAAEAGAPAFALVARRAVWMEARDAETNAVLFSGELNPGDRFTPPAGRSDGMRLHVGDPSGLTVEVAGEALGPLARTAAVLRDFDLSAPSLRARAAANAQPRPAAVASAPRAPAPAPVQTAAPLAAPPVWNVSSPAAQPLPAAQRVQRPAPERRPEQRIVSNPPPSYVYPEAAPGNGGRAFGSMRPVD